MPTRDAVGQRVDALIEAIEARDWRGGFRAALGNLFDVIFNNLTSTIGATMGVLDTNQRAEFQAVRDQLSRMETKQDAFLARVEALEARAVGELADADRG